MRKLSVKYENPIDNIIYLYVEPLAPYMHKYNITPNMITTFGNISWVYGLYLLYNHEYVYSALLFGLSYYFDCLDGYVARKYDLISIFGDYYDHISDVTKGFSYLSDKISNHIKKLPRIRPPFGITATTFQFFFLRHNHLL